jgi:hypothetical protein
VRGSFLRGMGGKDRAIRVVRAGSAENARSDDDFEKEVRNTLGACTILILSTCELGK